MQLRVRLKRRQRWLAAEKGQGRWLRGGEVGGGRRRGWHAHRPVRLQHHAVHELVAAAKQGGRRAAGQWRRMFVAKRKAAAAVGALQTEAIRL